MALLYTIERVRRQATDWRKCLPMTSDKRLIQNVQHTRKTQQKENKQPIKTWPKTLTETSPKKIYRWQRSI